MLLLKQWLSHRIIFPHMYTPEGSVPSKDLDFNEASFALSLYSPAHYHWCASPKIMKWNPLKGKSCPSWSGKAKGHLRAWIHNLPHKYPLKKIFNIHNTELIGLFPRFSLKCLLCSVNFCSVYVSRLNSSLQEDKTQKTPIMFKCACVCVHAHT